MVNCWTENWIISMLLAHMNNQWTEECRLYVLAFFAIRMNSFHLTICANAWVLSPFVALPSVKTTATIGWPSLYGRIPGENIISCSEYMIFTVLWLNVNQWRIQGVCSVMDQISFNFIVFFRNPPLWIIILCSLSEDEAMQIKFKLTKHTPERLGITIRS